MVKKVIISTDIIILYQMLNPLKQLLEHVGAKLGKPRTPVVYDTCQTVH